MTDDKIFEDWVFDNMPAIEELWGTPSFDEIDTLLKAWLGDGLNPEQASSESSRYGNTTTAQDTVRNALGNRTQELDDDIPF